MSRWRRVDPEIERIAESEILKSFLRRWNEREARPRVACSDCQFEYAEEDGHECNGQGEV